MYMLPKLGPEAFGSLVSTGACTAISRIRASPNRDSRNVDWMRQHIEHGVIHGCIMTTWSSMAIGQHMCMAHSTRI